MRRPVTRWLAVLLLLLAATAGCVSLPVKGPALLLARADRQAREGAWEEAVASYDEYLARFPDDRSAPRVLESRNTLAAMLAARAELIWRREEVARLRDEVIRLRDDRIHLRAEGTQLREELTHRERDLVRTRQELAARQAEAERLRADIERLKEIDLKLERKR